jgi:glycosyltransferase involved in cell wall biosynthesis
MALKPSDIHLVVTVALPKEVPRRWFAERGVPVVTLNALKSGILSSVDRIKKGILLVITGPGVASSEEAAVWISENLSPLYILNVGTCGVLDRSIPLLRWIRPNKLCSEHGQGISLEPRIPLDVDTLIPVDSLLTVNKPSADSMPEKWRKYQAVDMEAYAQARVFLERGFSFHCLKFGTDYLCRDYISQFNKNLPLFVESIKRLFSFLEQPEEPSVSVVIPVFNREGTIKRAIDSVLTQSFRPTEVVVVDDGSTDRTPEILHRYNKKTLIIRLPQNLGVSKARNVGASSTKGKWIAFLDSDDLWKPHKLLCQVEYLKRYPFYQIIQSEEIWFRKGRRVNPCKHHRKPLGWAWHRSLQRCLISPSGVLIKRALFERYGGFREDMPVCEDYDLWIRITRDHPVGLDPTASVVKHGGGDDQLSRTYPAMDRYRVRALLDAFLNERYPPFKRVIAEEMRTKLSILIKGAVKRGRKNDVEYYKTLLKVTDECLET